jgi:hypothetical protein
MCNIRQVTHSYCLALTIQRSFVEIWSVNNGIYHFYHLSMLNIELIISVCIVCHLFNMEIVTIWNLVLSKLHSLTDAPDQRRVVAISRPTSSCWSHVRLGRPRGRFQSIAGQAPSDISIASFSAWWAGASCGRRQIWPKREWRRSATSMGHEPRSLPDGTVWNMVIPLDSKDSALRHHVECLSKGGYYSTSRPRQLKTKLLWVIWYLQFYRN